MTQRPHLGEFEMITLASLLRLKENAYGVVIRQDIERQCRRSVSIGAVYTTLNRLEEKGYVSSRKGAPTPTRGGRAKRFFRIEASGTLALKSSLRTLNRMVAGLAGNWGTT